MEITFDDENDPLDHVISLVEERYGVRLQVAGRPDEGPGSDDGGDGNLQAAPRHEALRNKQDRT
ncbi:hypothetical protein ACQE98_10585 [Ornithinimicrobium sp. W1679]|uniref:hypothetical protein n=1 Tax=unclassified Ornithinimicrobium TaxID=2615080 RepID=UPI003CED9136